MTEYSRTAAVPPLDYAVETAGLTANGSRLARTIAVFFKAVRNRLAARPLNEMSDWQLADIGLTRSDVAASMERDWQGDPTLELARRAQRNILTKQL